MNRRTFIRNGALASLTGSSAFAFLSSCTKSSEQKPVAVAGDPAEFILDEITIDGLQQKMQAGEMTARTIAEMYLKRIQEIDKKGPFLNSVIEINPDALQIADALDQERKDGKVRGPLHGIPILIKDNIDTADKMMTTAGSLALEGNIARQDAFAMNPTDVGCASSASCERPEQCFWERQT